VIRVGQVVPRLVPAFGDLSAARPQGHPQPVCTESDRRPPCVRFRPRTVARPASYARLPRPRRRPRRRPCLSP